MCMYKCVQLLLNVVDLCDTNQEPVTWLGLQLSYHVWLFHCTLIIRLGIDKTQS